LFTGAVNSDLKSRLGLHEHELVVGILAALRPEKDHETFLRAASLASERNPRARFIIVGDGRRMRTFSLACSARDETWCRTCLPMLFDRRV
jgi:glycosyltransferase involved in cell wall biosynthesis